MGKAEHLLSSTAEMGHVVGHVMWHVMIWGWGDETVNMEMVIKVEQ
jgi:hypothetical protein